MIGVVAGIVAVQNALPWSIVALAIGGGFLSSLILTAFLHHQRQHPRNEAEARLRALTGALNNFRPSLENRRLHREVDATAAQLLEAGAYYWQRIRTTLDGPYWSGMNPADDLRYRAREAADQAMDGLAQMLSPCVGKPAKTPQDDVRSIVDDFKDGDIEDALKGLKSLTKGGKPDYTHRSPHIGPLFEPARRLAEQLKLLSAEVDQMATRALRETQTIGVDESGGDAIYDILTEMHARRVAESELESPDQQSQTQR